MIPDQEPINHGISFRNTNEINEFEAMGNQKKPD
jgi:hypothetical protein